jgi:hypothetical protein
MSNYTYQHDPRISGADFESDFIMDSEEECPACGSYFVEEGYYPTCEYDEETEMQEYPERFYVDEDGNWERIES